MNAINIARYVIQENAKTEPITNLKLQKILYYIQGYSYRKLGDAAFGDPIYRWPYGPVVPTVYFAYNSNRANKIYEMDDSEAEPIKAIRAYDGMKKLIDEINGACRKKTATQLVSMTHKERPWLETPDSKEISEETIRSFFESNDPLNICGLEH